MGKGLINRKSFPSFQELPLQPFSLLGGGYPSFCNIDIVGCCSNKRLWELSLSECQLCLPCDEIEWQLQTSQGQQSAWNISRDLRDTPSRITGVNITNITI